MYSRANWRFLIILFVWLAASSTFTRAQAASPGSEPQYTRVVNTTAGPVRGVEAASADTYLGIPYAEAPVGDLRWRPPEPHLPWHSVLDATSFGRHCLQATAKSKQLNASEDCLFLNVYVPRRQLATHHGRASAPFPVMVWIHGGANAVFASEEYDPTPLVETDDGVIVVTLNYRLGPFGFLAHPALDTEGHLAVNYGFLDQQLALKWVRENIARFGGDDHNITIFGESAGGLGVGVHLASPSAAGLFDKAIIESGAYQLDTPSLQDSEKLGVAFADRMGCKNQTAKCLRALQAATILAGSGESNAVNAAFNQSTVDGQILRESLREAFEHGRINRVPILQGNNRDEGHQWPTWTTDGYRTELTDLAKRLGTDPEQLLSVYSLQMYSSPSAAVGAAIGDLAFACSAQASNRMLSKWVPTYAYEFGDEGRGGYGVSHGAEPRYLFIVKRDLEDLKVDPADAQTKNDKAVNEELDGGPDTLPAPSRRLSEAMRLAWITFAKDGKPNTPLTPKWPLVPEGVEILNPSLPGALASSELADRHHCNLWSNASLIGHERDK